MYYRFTLLSLFAPFIAASFLESAPAPRRTYPEICALVYVGKGQDEEENARWVTRAVAGFTHFAFKTVDDPQVQKLAVAKDKTREELSAWIKTKIRVGTLEGTSVIRVWFTDGTPEEQAVLVNATLRAYLNQIERERQSIKANLDAVKKLKARKQDIQEYEDQYNRFPRVLEWASVMGKR